MESERWSIEVKHTLRHGPLSQFFSALTSLFRRFGLAYLKGKDISPKYSPNFFGVKREIKGKRSVKKPAHRRYAVRLDAAKRFYPDETPGAAAACAPPPPHAREHRRCNCCCATAFQRQAKRLYATPLHLDTAKRLYPGESPGAAIARAPPPTPHARGHQRCNRCCAAALKRPKKCAAAARALPPPSACRHRRCNRCCAALLTPGKTPGAAAARALLLPHAGGHRRCSRCVLTPERILWRCSCRVLEIFLN